MSTTLRSPNPPPPPAAREVVPAAWSGTAPILDAGRATVRGLILDDAESLFAVLNTEPVGRFILPPPDSAERFGRFIEWTNRQQASGRHLCFGIVPAGQDTAVGLIQVRRENSDFSTAEWGFALSERFWGTGIFMATATTVLDYLFGPGGLHRVEARTILGNGRAHGALLKLGAVKEGLLRRGFCRHGEYFDQQLWSILAEDWLGGTGRPEAGRIHRAA